MTMENIAVSQSGAACGDVFVCSIFTHAYSIKLLFYSHWKTALCCDFEATVSVGLGYKI